MKIWLLLYSLLLLYYPITAQPLPTEAEMIKLYEVETPPYYVRSTLDVEWSADGKLFAARFDRYGRDDQLLDTLWRVYEVESGEVLHGFTSKLPPRNDPSTGETRFFKIKFADEGDQTVMLTRDAEDRLRIYDADTGQLRLSMEDVRRFPLYSPDGKHFLLDTTTDTILRIYDATDFTLEDTLEGSGIGGWNVSVWSPDSSTIIVVFSGTRLFEASPIPYLLWKPNAHVLVPIEQRTWRPFWSEDGTQVATGSSDNEIEIYDAANGRLVDTVDGFPEKPTTPLHMNERYLVTLSGSYVDRPTTILSVWDIEKREFIHTNLVDSAYYIAFEDDQITLIEPSIQARYITLGDEIKIKTIDFGELSPIRYPSPDRRWFVTLAISWQDYMARLGLFTIQPYKQLDSFTQAYTSYISWSPDSQHFTTVGDKFIIWKVVEQSQ